MNITQVLSGHDSPETAYVVNDYPYGFRLRCKIRYWLDYRKGQGFRLCSQTTNPKVSGEVWNKPKKSTYSPLGVMYLDEKSHVAWSSPSAYDLTKLEEFAATFAAGLEGPNHQYELNFLRAVQAARVKRDEARANGTV